MKIMSLKGLGLTPLLRDPCGFMPPWLKTKQIDVPFINNLNTASDVRDRRGNMKITSNTNRGEGAERRNFGKF